MEATTGPSLLLKLILEFIIEIDYGPVKVFHAVRYPVRCFGKPPALASHVISQPSINTKKKKTWRTSTFPMHM